MNSVFRPLVFFLFLIKASSVFAQQPNLEFNTFTPLEKITNSKSSSIIQDSVGYIWIGTEEGLYRYDGQSVYTYQFVENDPHSIPSNIINKLFVDSHKNLWVSTNEGLCIYNPEFDNLTPIIVQSDLKGMKRHFTEKLDLYRNIAESKGINLYFEIFETLIAFADINLLETSLWNLTNNAIKYTHEGGTILIKANQQQDVIKISVIDSGTGMNKVQIENLFNIEKTQTRSGTNGEKGSGLGLMLCKEFVEKNKGTITDESPVG